MTRPTRYTIALAFTLAALIAVLIYLRPVCTCELGHPDIPYAANETSAEDCPVHGSK